MKVRDKMQLVINIDDKLYEIIKNPKKLETMYHAGRLCEAVRNGTPLPKGHFIAICESDYPITEKVENILKETAFIGGDEKEEDMYCFDIKEIIEADKGKVRDKE